MQCRYGENYSNEFNKNKDRTLDEHSTLQPQLYENKIKDKNKYLPKVTK